MESNSTFQKCLFVDLRILSCIALNSCVNINLIEINLFSFFLSSSVPRTISSTPNDDEDDDENGDDEEEDEDEDEEEDEEDEEDEEGKEEGIEEERSGWT
jgi:hypothetical protein